MTIEQLIREIVREELSLLTMPAQLAANEDVLLNEKEALALLRISPGTAVTYRKTGRLPFMRIGRKIMYSRNEVMAFLANTKIKGKSIPNESDVVNEIESDE